jgi:hypothetical protein
MHLGKRKDLQSTFSGDLEEVQQEIQLWRSKAAEWQTKIVAFALRLSADASQIVFNGDMIVLNAPGGRHSDVPLTLDLAAIRRIVCNLKILQAQREQLESRKSAPIATSAQSHPLENCGRASVAFRGNPPL